MFDEGEDSLTRAPPAAPPNRRRGPLPTTGALPLPPPGASKAPPRRLEPGRSPGPPGWGARLQFGQPFIPPHFLDSRIQQPWCVGAPPPPGALLRRRPDALAMLDRGGLRSRGSRGAPRSARAPRNFRGFETTAVAAGHRAHLASRLSPSPDRPRTACHRPVLRRLTSLPRSRSRSSRRLSPSSTRTVMAPSPPRSSAPSCAPSARTRPRRSSRT